MAQLASVADQLDVLSVQPDMLHISKDMSAAHLLMLMNDASIDQIFSLDLSLKITAWNRACERVHRIPREQAVGKFFVDVVAGVAEYPHIMEALVDALKGLKSFVSSEKGAYKGGYYEHHFIPLTSGDEVIGVMIVIHDVAHRIKTEQELRRLNEELQGKTAEIASFNWIASHDLKEPLRKIYTFIEMVATQEGTKISDAARSNLRRAQGAAQRMSLLTDDIATFAQVAAPVERVEQVDLQDLLQQAILRTKRLLEKDDAIILADNLPTFPGYAQMLSLLFNHILNNALKFQKDGVRSIVHVKYSYVHSSSLDHRSAYPDAVYHCISFTDNGIGFAQKYSEKVFGMFQRLHAQGTYKGTGMGLAICRKVAEAHKGFIAVDSVEGTGSTFNCYFQELAPH